MQLAPRSRTVGILEPGGPSFATCLRAHLTTAIVLIEVCAVAAVPVASDLREIQARPVQLAAAPDTVTEASAGLEVGEVTGEIVSARGSLGAVGQDGVPAARLVGSGELSGYVSPYVEQSTITFDGQNALSQGAIPYLVPIATQIIADHIGDPLMTGKANSSPPEVADGLVDVSSGPSTAFGDRSWAVMAAAIGELRTQLLKLLVSISLKLVLLYVALANFLVIASGT